MHELSIISSIFSIIEDHADKELLTSITKVSLHVGALRHVQDDMLRFAFKAVAQGTRAEGAVLAVDYIPVITHCRQCAAEFEVSELMFICPQCESTDLEVLKGKEIIIESIEGERE
jgi:hydrogenase nickel incorporation protein HypA/HybF